MKYKIASAIIILVALGVGYYFGYDHGFEKATGGDVMVEEPLSEINTLEGAELIEADIVGMWQSTEDREFSREFTKDTVTDYYDREQTGTPGSWTIFTSENPLEAFKGTIEKDAIYLAIMFNEETLFFKVVTVSGTNLDLIYLDRGGVLSFVRIPELE